MNPYELGANQLLIAFDAVSDFNKASSGSYKDAKKYDQAKDFRKKKAAFDAQRQGKVVQQIQAKRKKLNRRQAFQDLKKPLPQSSAPKPAAVKVKKVKKPKTMGRKAMKFLKRNKVGMGLAGAGVLGAAMLN